MDVRKAALLVSTSASFLTSFMASSITVALPSVGTEFMLDAVSLTWISTSFLIAAATFLIPFGRLADIYGRKRIFSCGIIIHTMASVVAASAPSGSVLIAGRAIQGVGGAMIFGTAVAILTSVYPAAERGRVLGLNVASVYLGLSLGPVLGGMLTQHLGWRSIFVFSIIVGMIIMGFVVARLRGEWAEAREETFDTRGAVLLSVGLALIMYGFSQLPGITGALTIVCGVIVVVAFFLWEQHAGSPLFDIRRFGGNTVFMFSNIAALINYSATYAVTFLLSLYLQYIKGLSPQAAGLVLIFQPAVMALCSPLAGRLSDRVEPQHVASVGMAVIVAGLVVFIFVGTSTPIWYVAANLTALGFGFGLFSSPNTNAVMSSVENRSYGIASATLGTMRLTGQMLSMGIVMILFAVTIGRVKIVPQYHPEFLRSMSMAFIVFSVLCVGGVFASLARGKMR